MKKSGRLSSMVVYAHAAARGIDAPALARGIARPDERYRSLRRRTSVVRRGPEMPDLRFPGRSGFADGFEPHPVENILPGRKAVQQHFRSEVAFGQRF